MQASATLTANPGPEELLTEFLLAIREIDKLLLQVSEGEDDPYQLDNAERRIPELTFSSRGYLARVVNLFNLTDFELAVIILGCLPHCDKEYAERFARLPLSAGRLPTFDLALTLFCPGEYERHAQRASFAPEAPLLQSGLIELFPARPGEEQAFMTSNVLFHYLLGHKILPASLIPVTRWLTAVDNENISTPLLQMIRQSASFSLIEGRVAAGADGDGWCASLAEQLDTWALWIDWNMLVSDRKNGAMLLKQWLNIANLFAVLPVMTFSAQARDTDARDNQQNLERFICQRAPALSLPLCCLIGQSTDQMPFPELSRYSETIGMPDIAQRSAWLRGKIVEPDSWDYQALVQRVSLSRRGINLAVREAEILARKRGVFPPQEQDFRSAFLRRARQNFGELASRIEPTRSWEDMVVSDSLQQHLLEVRSAVRWREKVLQQGFSAKIGRSSGISALFYGDSGTGKSLAAEVLAAELGVDLIRVDLATVVNKYIGETEKNIARIFDLAEQDAGVLFFDEADALFGKRSETKDAKDRHANIEVAYLLQRLENHPGLVILATNNRGHLDDAFTRRFSFIIRFTYPDRPERERLWCQAWPAAITFAEPVDFSRLAQISLTGANIRNIALLASWLAAEESGDIPVIGYRHIEQAVRRELNKIGRNQI
jgi:hypothetical protein